MTTKIKPRPELVNDPIAWVKAAIEVAKKRGGCRRNYVDGSRVCAVGALATVINGVPREKQLLCPSVTRAILMSGIEDRVVSNDNDLRAPRNQNPAVWALRRLLKRLQEAKR